jgi:hypothetical protein
MIVWTHIELVFEYLDGEWDLSLVDFINILEKEHIL